jgi:hypothetical protein
MIRFGAILDREMDLWPPGEPIGNETALHLEA